MMTIAPPTTPPAMPPFWSTVSELDVSGSVVGVGVGSGVELVVEDEVVVLDDDVVEAVNAPLTGIGVAVATAPTPPNCAPGMAYDHRMI